MQSKKCFDKICQFEIGHKYCELFERIGVPREDKWRSLLHSLRSVHKYSYYSHEQKNAIGELLVKTLEANDFSDSCYRNVFRKKQNILASSYAKRLEEALKESADLAADFKKNVYEHKGAVERLEEESVAAVLSGADPEEIVSVLRNTFQDVISVMKKDAERLDHISKTDALTGLYNRRAFDTNLEAGIAAWDKRQVPMCLLLLDIDNLKDFNDRFGHRIGDQALQTFSQIMQEVAHRDHVDEDVCCCRFGGDEFAILLHGPASVDVVQIAQSIRTRLETYDFVVRDSQGRIINRNVQMTVSCGFSHIEDCCPQNIAEHLLDAADAALYEAKDSGRNRIVKYSRNSEGYVLSEMSNEGAA